jgi:hypothetical protein
MKKSDRVATFVLGGIGISCIGALLASLPLLVQGSGVPHGLAKPIVAFGEVVCLSFLFDAFSFKINAITAMLCPLLVIIWWSVFVFLVSAFVKWYKRHHDHVA